MEQKGGPKAPDFTAGISNYSTVGYRANHRCNRVPRIRSFDLHHAVYLCCKTAGTGRGLCRFIWLWDILKLRIDGTGGSGQKLRVYANFWNVHPKIFPWGGPLTSTKAHYNSCSRSNHGYALFGCTVLHLRSSLPRFIRYQNHNDNSQAGNAEFKHLERSVPRSVLSVAFMF